MGDMKLSAFLAEQKLSSAEFAAQISVNRSSVSRFCRGERKPDLVTLQRIHEATGGKVTAEDFFADQVIPPKAAAQ